MRKGFDFPPSTAFWTLVIGLLVCSVIFASSVELRRRGFDTFIGEVPIKSGETVTLHRVIDGDELSVRRGDGHTFVLRLLGIKCFDPRVAEAGIGAAGQGCMGSLEQLVEDESAHLVVEYEGNLSRDKNNRVLAYLRAGELDVGKQLVHDGWAMVFVRYGFSREDDYRAELVGAKNEGRGLWANDKASARADALYAAWTAQREDGT